MPTTKKEPPSTNRRVEELKQFLKPSGLVGDQAEFLHSVIGQVLDLFAQTDDKARHFLTLVFTREDDNDPPLVSMDTVTSFNSKAYALTLVEAWIARTKADIDRT